MYLLLLLLIQFNSIQFRVSFPFILNFNFRVPVDPLEWQISQDTANTIVASLANTIGAAESVLRVAATGHDKRLFIKVFQFSYYYYFLTSYLLTSIHNQLIILQVIICLYALSALGRLALGITIAYAGQHPSLF
jgi:hypothetical protein